MRRVYYATSAAAVAFVTVVLAAACGGDIEQAAPCGEIPTGGCPKPDGTCSDPTCVSIYACIDGAWRFASACNNDGATRASTSDAGDAGGRDSSASDAAIARDAGFVVPPGANGGPGCGTLQPPDCPLALALSCSLDSCCGCEDLYVCRNGGWDTWGTCRNGNLTPASH